MAAQCPPDGPRLWLSLSTALKMDRPHLHALMASCPRQAGQTQALVKSPNKHGSIEGLSAHKQTTPTHVQPAGANSPSQLLRLGESHGGSAGDRDVSRRPGSWSLTAGVSAWGYTGTSNFRDSAKHSHKWGFKLHSPVSVNLHFCVI